MIGMSIFPIPMFHSTCVCVVTSDKSLQKHRFCPRPGPPCPTVRHADFWTSLQFGHSACGEGQCTLNNLIQATKQVKSTSVLIMGDFNYGHINWEERSIKGMLMVQHQDLLKPQETYSYTNMLTFRPDFGRVATHLSLIWYLVMMN